MKKLNRYIPDFKQAAAGDFGSGGSGQLDYTDLMPALDVAGGLTRVMNNKKLYFRLLRSFSGPVLAADIIEAIEIGDHNKVQQAAHTLKGVSANLSLSELMSICLQIETRARALEGAGDLLPALKQAVEAATTAIELLLASEEA